MKGFDPETSDHDDEEFQPERHEQHEFRPRHEQHEFRPIRHQNFSIEEESGDMFIPSEERHIDYNDDDIEFTGNPYIANANSTEFWGHHHHGEHHKGGHHHGSSMGKHSHHDSDKEHRASHKDNWKKKRDPYKEWLNKLPYMHKNQARIQAEGFWNMIIGAIALWATIIYMIQQGFQFYCINQCIKAQKVLEEKYMGPEIVAVQPTQRQVAASTTAPQQPVIQYIVQPPQPIQASATGNIVSANQIV